MILFVHSLAEQGRLDVDNHIGHSRAVLECMRTNKLYANAYKCIFGAEEIPLKDVSLVSAALERIPRRTRL